VTFFDVWKTRAGNVMTRFETRIEQPEQQHFVNYEDLTEEEKADLPF